MPNTFAARDAATIAPARATRHLDLGCGAAPRNPYHRERLVGVDLRDIPADALAGRDVDYVQANFVLDALPFPDGHFDSVSAYDVIEHVPRQMHVHGEGLVYPFIRLMNEIHRVLAPGGLFLASTPGYPRPEAFQDPTHVNFITVGTAHYFAGQPAGQPPLGRMYGFDGDFEIRVNRFCTRNNYTDRTQGAARRFARRWQRKLFKGGWSDIVWELRALK